MLDKIKQRVSLQDLLDTLGVKVKGHTALCPLHQDTRASFGFNNKKGLWYCFVCNKGGDIATLVMETQGLDFKESLNWLNDTFSLGLTHKKPKRNYHLEALNENYQLLKSSLKQEFNDNCERYYELMQQTRTQNYPYLFWTAKDYTFEILYHEYQDSLESKLRELEDVRFKLRAEYQTSG